ncbi:MAG: hypothetical protein V4603_02515 [Pseudomonadota bacterium]
MKVLNSGEVQQASGGNFDGGYDGNYYEGYVGRYQADASLDYTGIYDVFAIMNQTPERWMHYFAGC